MAMYPYKHVQISKMVYNNLQGMFCHKLVSRGIDFFRLFIEFIPYRNEAIEIFFAIAQYRNPTTVTQQLQRFFENMIPFMYPPKGITSWNSSDFDNFKFIIYELFLYAISCLLKYDAF